MPRTDTTQRPPRASLTPAERIARFLARIEATTPGRTTVWSDRSDRAVGLRLDDLRELLTRWQDG